MYIMYLSTFFIDGPLKITCIRDMACTIFLNKAFIIIIIIIYIIRNIDLPQDSTIYFTEIVYR